MQDERSETEHSEVESSEVEMSADVFEQDVASEIEVIDEDSDTTEHVVGHEEIDLITRLSGVLFVTTRPLGIDKLAPLLKVSEEEVADALEELKSSLIAAKLGFELINVGGAYQYRSLHSIKSTIQKMITPKMRRLSKAAAETLAVVAYKQPVTRAEIEAIRGVDALPTLRTLLDGTLVRIIGREDTPGSPALYGTTDKFLERFGLSDLGELPTIREVTELMDEPGESVEDEIEDTEEAFDEEEYVNN